jgi:probable rRNA maturation factor
MANPAPKTPDIEKYARSSLKKWLKKVQETPALKKRVHGLEKVDFFVDLTIATAPRMTKLNETFRKKSYPTDVLSFPADAFFQRLGVLGDVVICAPTALKQAKEFQHAWKKEIDVLLVHAILHLLDFDHERGAKDAVDMSRWEKKLLGTTYDHALIKRSEAGELSLSA